MHLMTSSLPPPPGEGWGGGAGRRPWAPAFRGRLWSRRVLQAAARVRRFDPGFKPALVEPAHAESARRTGRAHLLGPLEGRGAPWSGPKRVCPALSMSPGTA